MSQPAVRIRPAEPQDLAVLVALEQATEGAPHWGQAIYAEILAPAAHPSLQRRLWVAEASSSVVAGFAVGSALQVGGTIEAELETVVVAKHQRRQGIGHALCAAVIDWAQALDATELHLEVRASSQGAIALYQGLGFITNGRRAMYYQNPAEDALLMSVQIL